MLLGKADRRFVAVASKIVSAGAAGTTAVRKVSRSSMSALGH